MEIDRNINDEVLSNPEPDVNKEDLKGEDDNEIDEKAKEILNQTENISKDFLDIIDSEEKERKPKSKHKTSRINQSNSSNPKSREIKMDDGLDKNLDGLSTIKKEISVNLEDQELGKEKK